MAIFLPHPETGEKENNPSKPVPEERPFTKERRGSSLPCLHSHVAQVTESEGRQWEKGKGKEKTTKGPHHPLNTTARNL